VPRLGLGRTRLLAAHHSIPASYSVREMAEAGGRSPGALRVRSAQACSRSLVENPAFAIGAGRFRACPSTMQGQHHMPPHGERARRTGTENPPVRGARSHSSDPYCVTTRPCATMLIPWGERSEKPRFAECRSTSRACGARGGRCRPDHAGARRSVRHFIPRGGGRHHISIFDEAGRNFGRSPLPPAAWALALKAGP
jgi:hypothetical protein